MWELKGSILFVNDSIIIQERYLVLDFRFMKDVEKPQVTLRRNTNSGKGPGKKVADAPIGCTD